jgi:hypothetical protein
MTESLPSDKNKHIRDYLSYYISLSHAPHYAVMITGPWGIGKTFLIKKLLAERFKDGKEYIYLSLYGLSSRDDLDVALFQAAYPLLGSKTVKVGARLSMAALKTLSKFYHVELPDFKVSDLASRPTAVLYVFDDLERCAMPINTVLGYINEFVEHDDQKVVIVANEQGLESEEYKTRKEKLIGKTLEMQSTFDEALAYFTTLIDSVQAKSFLEAKRAEIASVYQQSGLNNLRILQQTMWDFERFFVALTERHREKDEAITVLLRSFFALSFEFKAGRLRQEHLKDWFSTTMDYMILQHDRERDRDTERERSPCEVAIDRYPEIDLSGTFLSPELVADIFSKGIIERSEIQAYLDTNSPYFIDKGTEPSWRTVWHFFERTGDEFTKAYKEMERQFDHREFLHPGELLQVFGLRLLLVRMGALGMSRATVVSECKTYIDDLYSAKRLQPLEVHQTEDTLSWGGYGGLGIHEKETDELRELDRYLEEKRKQAAVDKYPDEARTLLEEMRNDPNLYYQRLCLTNSDKNLYYRIPILSVINPSDFVTALLQQSPPHQALILRAFKARYEQGDLKNRLAQEQPWLGLVQDELAKQTESMSVMEKHRLTIWIDGCIRPFL